MCLKGDWPGISPRSSSLYSVFRALVPIDCMHLLMILSGAADTSLNVSMYSLMVRMS